MKQFLLLTAILSLSDLDTNWKSLTYDACVDMVLDQYEVMPQALEEKLTDECETLIKKEGSK